MICKEIKTENKERGNKKMIEYSTLLINKQYFFTVNIENSRPNYTRLNKDLVKIQRTYLHSSKICSK